MSARPPSAGPPVLLINPRSFRASRWGLARRAGRLARRAGIRTIEVRTPGEFQAVLDDLHACRQQQIWLLSGDGTIHWIAEYLARLADDWSPALLLLGGGRANVVPRECGGYPAMPALRRALRRHRAGVPLEQRRLATLRLSQPGGEVRHGFFLAGGVIHDGVQYCSAHRARGNSWLHRSLAADFYAVFKLLLLSLLRRSPLPPYTPMSVRLADGRALPRLPMRILLAGTLEMRDALYNPFAATGEGAVRVTAIAATAPHFWRHLPGILRGRFDPALTPERGVLSGRSAVVEVHGISAYSLDGEGFGADPDLPLCIASGVELAVLQP